MLILLLLVAETARGADPAPFSDEVRLQIQELQAEKEARTPAQQKMGSQLVLAAKRQRKVPFTARVEGVLQKTVKVEADGAALVDITANVTPELLTALKTAGAKIVASVPRFRAVRARVPLVALEGLAARGDVNFIKNAVPAFTHTGPIDSEGDTSHATGGTTGARATYNVTGAGVKVGVISDSADYLANSQASGELGPVTVLQDLPGETGEGTAMMEIVHDIAPGAEIFFATAYLSEASFAQNILNLRAAGCDIIVDDVGYFDESPFQNGPVAEAVEQVSADGALVFSAAGNEGSKDRGTSGTWEGDFLDAGATAPPISKAGRLQSFGGLGYNVVTSVGFGETLFWSDPRGASTNDYDLYVLNASGTSIVAFSNNTQNGTQDPFELIVQAQQPIAVGMRLVVVKAATAAPRFMQVSTLRGTLTTSTSGKISGHSGCPSVMSTAAVSAAFAAPFTTSSRVESFSSDGPRRMFFNTDGTAITPGDFSSTGGRVFQKPDLAAADGVTTSVPRFAPFYGTSAAAPHAAAIAALLKSQNLKMTAQQLRSAVLSNTIDIEGAGVDRDTGYGIVQPGPTLLATTAGAKVEQVSLAITAESYTPANGAPDPGERLTVALALRNSGGTATSNLTATLLPNGGVSNPTSSQAYALPVGGTDTQSFSFTANAAAGGKITLTFRLADGATSYGTLTQSYPLGTLTTAQTFSNPANITINDYTGTTTAQAATPYPSPIVVSGVTGAVGKVTARLNGFTHSYPGDVKVLLVSPSGTRVMLMAYAGGGAGALSTDLTFDDDGAAVVDPSTSGTYHPIDYSSGGLYGDPFPAPAPSGTFSTTLSSFNAETPNGSWSLYVVDDGPSDNGVISGGWTLTINPVRYSGATNPGTDLAVSMSASAPAVAIGQPVVYTITVYNNGTATASGVQLVDTLPSSFLSLSSFTVSQGTGATAGTKLTANLGLIAAKSFATVTLTGTAIAAGSFNNVATVSTTASDVDLTNNTASLAGAVGVPNLTLVQPPGWSDKLVVSSVTGTNTDSGLPTNPYFLDFAIGNTGTAVAVAYFSTRIFVDNVLARTIDRQLALPAGGVYRVEDVLMPALPGGLHTVRIVTDSASVVGESNETDNDYTRTIGIAIPTISALADASMLEDGTPAQINFTVGDSVGSPAELTLSGGSSNQSVVPNGNIVFSGTGAARSMRITPLPDASGTIVITVTARAGDGRMGTGTMNFTVTPINDLPSLDALVNLNIQEDSGVQTVALTGISAGGGESQSLTVTATSTNPTLIPAPQVIYTSAKPTGTLRFTPQPDRFGSTVITVTLTDDGGTANGGMNTISRSFNVNVANVNDPPTLDAIAEQKVLEGAGPQTITLTGIGPGAFESDTLTVSALSNNPELVPNPTVTYAAGSASAQLSFISRSSRVHTATITVTVDDGQALNSTALRTFLVTVAPVNDAPSFLHGPDVAVLEDAGAQTIAGWAAQISAGPDDESDQTVDFLVSVDHPELFAGGPVIAPDGTLTFTPAADAHGSATVAVRLHDSGGTDNNGQDTSAAQTFQITIASVNDAPSFTAGGNQQVQQNAGAQHVAAWAKDITAGPSDEAGQVLNFLVSTDQPSLFAGVPAIAADGTLSFTPAGDHSGTAQVTVRLHDSGGTDQGGQDTSAPQVFTILIGAVNDAPSFTKGANQSVAQNGGAQTVPHWATNILAGPADEGTQTVSFEVTTPDTQLFSQQPAISPEGTLSFTPDPKGSGTATVTVTLHDDGGTLDGGKDSSTPQTFSIAVTTYLEETGTYNGLVTAPATSPKTHASTGLIRVAVARTGAFTAVLRLGGAPFTVRGQFDQAGVATFGRTKLPAQALNRSKLPPLLLQLNLDVSGGSDQLTGTLSENGAPFAALTADRALYTVPKLAKAPYRAVAATLLGSYTVLLPVKAPAQQTAALVSPPGDGIATLTVNTRGQAALRAILSDGTRINYVNSLSKANSFPIYLVLNRGAGSLSGTATFRDLPGISDLDSSDLNWFKPASTAKLYPLGWMSGLALDLVGSKLTAVAGQSTLAPLAPVDAVGNVQAAFAGGSLAPAGVLHLFNLDPHDLARPLLGDPVPFSLRLVRTTGLIAGRFTDPATHRQLPYYGVVLQKQGLASGFFLDTQASGTFILTPAAPAGGAIP